MEAYCNMQSSSHVAHIKNVTTEAEFDALVRAHSGANISNEPVDRDDPCWFFFTSGTTGRPKASVLTHGQMAFVLLNHLNDLMPGTGRADRSI